MIAPDYRLGLPALPTVAPPWRTMKAATVDRLSIVAAKAVIAAATGGAATFLRQGHVAGRTGRPGLRRHARHRRETRQRGFGDAQS
jgi:hypothetical protein